MKNTVYCFGKQKVGMRFKNMTLGSVCLRSRQSFFMEVCTVCSLTRTLCLVMDQSIRLGSSCIQHSENVILIYHPTPPPPGPGPYLFIVKINSDPLFSSYYVKFHFTIGINLGITKNFAVQFYVINYVGTLFVNSDLLEVLILLYSWF